MLYEVITVADLGASIDTLMEFYEAGSDAGGFKAGIENALARGSTSSTVTTLPFTRTRSATVITSYSIHYTKLYEVADRDVWDFALVSIAVAMDVDGESIGDSRFVCGGVAATPYRLKDVERAARGKPLSADTADQVAALAIV